MTFNALVRYELDGQAVHGELLETKNDGFKVSKLNGNIVDGFTPVGTEPIVVKKVCTKLHLLPNFPRLQSHTKLTQNQSSSAP